MQDAETGDHDAVHAVGQQQRGSYCPENLAYSWLKIIPSLDLLCQAPFRGVAGLPSFSQSNSRLPLRFFPLPADGPKAV